MKATPTLERGMNTPAGEPKSFTPIDTANSTLEDARALSHRVIALAQLLSGFSEPDADPTEAAQPSNILGRLRGNALNTRSSIALAHEALDFIEGQIS